MLEELAQKLRPYRVLIVPATCYELDHSGNKGPVSEFLGFEKRFMTRSGFERFIAKLEDRNHQNYPGNVDQSIRPNQRTYVAIPDLNPWLTGHFSIEIPKLYRPWFEKVSAPS